MDMEFDFEDERTVGEDNMILQIEGFDIEIPEELVKEKAKLMNTTEEIVMDGYLKEANLYLRNKKEAGTFDINKFPSQFVAYLDNKLSVFRY